MTTSHASFIALLGLQCIGIVCAVVDHHHGNQENLQAFTTCSAIGCRCLTKVDGASCDWCDVVGYQPPDHTPREVDTRNCYNQIEKSRRTLAPDPVSCHDSSRDQTVAIAAISCVDAGLVSFPVDLLKTVSSLFFLDLRRNAMVRLSSMSLTVFGRWTLDHLRVAENKIQRINIDTPWSRLLKTLDLSGNHLVAINRSTFASFGRLTRLDLSTNRLEHIESGAFSSLSELSRLDLSWNRLTRLKSGTFDGLASLGYLLLTGNSISTVAYDIFRPLERLVYVVLRDNPLGEQVDDIQFYSSFLSYVDLSECHLTTLPLGLPSSVRYLQLRRNNITEVTRRSAGLRRLGSLAVLVLDDNIIDTIEEGALLRLGHLDQLWLNGNRLTTVPRRLPARLRRLLMDFNYVDYLTATDTFQTLSRLTTLSLMSNIIVNISDDVLAPLTSLRRLDLANNRLRRIGSGTFSHQSSLRLLQLSGNPLDQLRKTSLSGLSSLTTLRLSYVPIPPSHIEDGFLDDVQRTLSRLELDSSPGLVKHFTRRHASVHFSDAGIESDFESLISSPPLEWDRIRHFGALSSDLVRLSPTFAMGFMPSATIRLTSARWHCDGGVLWFRDWLQMSKSIIDDEPIRSEPDNRTFDGTVSQTVDDVSAFQLVLGVHSIPSAPSPPSDVIFMRSIPPLQESYDGDNRCATPRELFDRKIVSLTERELLQEPSSIDERDVQSPTSGLVFTVTRQVITSTRTRLNSSPPDDNFDDDDNDVTQRRQTSSESSSTTADDVFGFPDSEYIGNDLGIPNHQKLNESKKPTQKTANIGNRFGSIIDIGETDYGDSDQANGYNTLLEQPPRDINSSKMRNFIDQYRTPQIRHSSVNSGSITSSPSHNSAAETNVNDDRMLITVSSVPRMRDSRSITVVCIIVAITIIVAVVMVIFIVRLVLNKRVVLRGMRTDNSRVIACRQKDGGVLYYSRWSSPELNDPRATRATPGVGNSSTISTDARQKLRVYKWEDF